MLKDRAILLLALGETLVWAGVFYLFPATLARWEAELDWTKSELTFAITLAVFTSGLCAPFAGRLIDRGFGPFQIAASAAVAGVCVVLLSQVAALWQFYALWLVIGVCLAGCLYEPCFAMVTRARGGDAKQAIIWITLVAGFAGTISFPMVHVLSESFGWRGACQIIGGFVVLVVAPILWLGAQALGPMTADPPTPKTRETYGTSPTYWLLGLGFGLLGVTHGATLHHLLPLLAERGLATEAAVLAAACIGPMQVFGRIAMVTLQGRISNHGFALFAFGAIGLSLVLLYISASTPALLAAFVLLFGSAYGTVSILRPVIIRELLGGANFGAKSGGLAFLYLSGSASSAFLGALVWSIGGYDAMLFVLIAVTTLGATLYSMAARRQTAED